MLVYNHILKCLYLYFTVSCTIIEKPKIRDVYADMEGHPAHYAALRLAENVQSL